MWFLLWRLPSSCVPFVPAFWQPALLETRWVDIPRLLAINRQSWQASPLYRLRIESAHDDSDYLMDHPTQLIDNGRGERSPRVSAEGHNRAAAVRGVADQ